MDFVKRIHYADLLAAHRDLPSTVVTGDIAAFNTGRLERHQTADNTAC